MGIITRYLKKGLYEQVCKGLGRMNWTTIPVLALLGLVYVILKKSERFEDKN